MGSRNRDHPQWRNDWRPPIPARPRPGQPLNSGLALALMLDSIPTAASGKTPPATAPLTPEEADRIAAYFRSRPGPAGDAERSRT